MAEEERVVYLDDRRVASGLDPVVTTFLALIAQTSPKPIKFPQMKAQEVILEGVNQSEVFKRVREAFPWVVSGRSGYYFELPPPAE